jgi:hypothetical protein
MTPLLDSNIRNSVCTGWWREITIIFKYLINSSSSFYFKFFEKITIPKKDKITINVQIAPPFEINNTPICCKKKHVLHWPTASQ